MAFYRHLTWPITIGNLTNLATLSLSNNQFTGSIPTSIGNLTNMYSLYLANNQLNGNIPDELGTLTNLNDLALYNNQLDGSIPASLSNLTGLSELDLSGNLLDGPIPAEFGTFNNLYQLNLSHNQLTSIPPELGNLTNLYTLHLEANQLTGSIPAELGNMANLSYLYLEGNHLTGTIPTGLGNLSGLRELHLNGNFLEGPLPSDFINLNPWELWTFNTNLCDPAALEFWFNSISNERTTDVSCDSPRATVKRRGIAVSSVRDAPYDISNSSSSLELAQALNMDVIYFPLGWDSIEVGNGEYNWRVLHDILQQAERYDLQLVLRIYNPPVWRTPNGAPAGAPPTNPDDLRQFMQLLTDHVRNGYYDYDFGEQIPDRPEVVAGYVIWNEPNISQQWGGQAPDPAAYMELLKAGYQGAKAGDPGAVVVSAPLAPTANKTGQAINDLEYLGQLYDLGLAGYVDAVGMNGLGFQHAPDYDTGTADYNFMRLQYLHDVMVGKGDTSHPVWALEVGWLLDNGYDMGSFEAFKVSPMDQAQYLNEAFEKANNDWPWLDLMSVWNLDYNRHYPVNSNFYWYSVASNDWATLLLSEIKTTEYERSFTSNGEYWTPDPAFSLHIGADTFSTATDFMLTLYDEIEQVVVGGFKSIGIHFSLEAADVSGDLSQFSSPIHLTLTIPDEVDNPEEVILYTYRDNEGRWVDTCLEDGNSCELDGRKFKIDLSHLSDFAMGIPESIYLPIIVKGN